MLEVDERHPSARSPARLLNFKTTADRASLSVRTLQRLVKARQFPAPVVLSANRLAFQEGEVEAWITGRPKAA
jgi:predicted DNA-binding transcriptional regulator AlpA